MKRKLQIDDLVLLNESEHRDTTNEFPIQRARVMFIDRKNEVLTVCILKQDRLKGDRDGMCECGFEDVYYLQPVK